MYPSRDVGPSISTFSYTGWSRAYQVSVIGYNRITDCIPHTLSFLFMNLCNAWSVQVNGVSSFVSLHARSGSHRQQSYPAFPIGWGGTASGTPQLSKWEELTADSESRSNFRNTRICRSPSYELCVTRPKSGLLSERGYSKEIR